MKCFVDFLFIYEGRALFLTPQQTRLKSELKPFNAVIQTCPVCGKIDVCLDDGHSCEDYIILLNDRESRGW